jgi:hypothetical protein
MWVNTGAKSGKTEPYFRVFLQKTFIETHAIYPSETEIEKWVRDCYSYINLRKSLGYPVNMQI